LFLAAEPLQALTPALIARIAPELLTAPAYSAQPQHSAGTAPLRHDESIEQVLQRFGGNRAAAASYLGISRTTLWRKLGEKKNTE